MERQAEIQYNVLLLGLGSQGDAGAALGDPRKDGPDTPC